MYLCVCTKMLMNIFFNRVCCAPCVVNLCSICIMCTICVICMQAVEWTKETVVISHYVCTLIVMYHACTMRAFSMLVVKCSKETVVISSPNSDEFVYSIMCVVYQLSF